MDASWRWAVAMAALCAACGSSGNGGKDSGTADAGVVDAAGSTDATALDGGPRDAAAVDAAPSDGAVPDASPFDGAVPDGAAVDAAGADAGPLMAAVTPVGTPTGTAASATIDAAGGTLLSADGRLSLSVPAGALAASTLITIQAITQNAPNGLGLAYRLTPSGLTFAQPATLTLHTTSEDLQGVDPLHIGLAYQDPMGRWVDVTPVTADTVAGTESVPIGHFTDWAFYAGCAMKRPNFTHVVILGAPSEIHIQCTETVGSQTAISWLAPVSPGDTIGLSPSVTGGGSIDPSGVSDLVYTPPATRPSPDPVTVHAHAIVRDRSGMTRMYDWSLYLLVLERDWRLQFDITHANTCTGAAQAQYTMTCSAMSGYFQINPDLTVQLNGPTGTCANQFPSFAGCNAGTMMSSTPDDMLTNLSGTVDGNSGTISLIVAGTQINYPHLMVGGSDVPAVSSRLPSPIPISNPANNRTGTLGPASCSGVSGPCDSIKLTLFTPP